MYNLTDKHSIEELLLALLPCWNNIITRPFKQNLDGELSLEMYYCIQTLRYFDGVLTMSELAKWMQIPKSQTTKLVNRLFDHGFVRRTEDLADRRIIRIEITEKALEYINNFIKDISCFDGLLDNIEDKDQVPFKEALSTISMILYKSLNP